LTDDGLPKKEHIMKRSIMTIVAIFWATSGLANEIYIDQVGDDLSLTITQTGSGNEVGDTTTDFTLAGDNMTFTITQTGDNNTIDAIIKGASYTGTWAFTGDNNSVDLLCSSSSAGDCDTVTVNITVGANTVGGADGNVFQVYLGETTSADVDNMVAAFTVDGDGNVIDVASGSADSDITVTIDNTSTASTKTYTDAVTSLSTTAGGNYVDIDQSEGGVSGHSITLDITGGGGKFDIDQAGLNDSTIDATFNGDDANVSISQND